MAGPKENKQHGPELAQPSMWLTRFASLPRSLLHSLATGETTAASDATCLHPTEGMPTRRLS